MEKMKMHSRDNVAVNVEAVGRLFPNALTEVMRDGKAVQAIVEIIMGFNIVEYLLW